MSYPKHVINVFATAFLLSGCGSELVAPERDQSAPIQTDDVAYRVELTANLGTIHLTITYRNETQETRFLSRCGHTDPGVMLQRSTGGAWVDAWVPDCPRVAAEPVVVLPGEAFTTPLTIRGFRRPHAAEPQTGAPTPGTYRLRALIHAEWDFESEAAPLPIGSPVPEEERVSNAFLITR